MENSTDLFLWPHPRSPRPGSSWSGRKDTSSHSVCLGPPKGRSWAKARPGHHPAPPVPQANELCLQGKLRPPRPPCSKRLDSASFGLGTGQPGNNSMSVTQIQSPARAWSQCVLGAVVLQAGSNHHANSTIKRNLKNKMRARSVPVPPNGWFTAWGCRDMILSLLTDLQQQTDCHRHSEDSHPAPKPPESLPAPQGRLGGFQPQHGSCNLLGICGRVSPLPLAL